MREQAVEYASQEMIEETIRLIHERYYELERRVGDLLKIYEQGNHLDIFEYHPSEHDFKGRIPVWICWWQGFPEAPEVVRLCRESVYKNFNQEEFVIIEIDAQNVKEYVDFPDWIWEKHQKGIISRTLLSDILRMALLYYHGGMWVDATYFLTKPFTAELVRDKALYSLHLKDFEGIHISQGRWTLNFLYTKKGELLPKFILNAFYYYFAAYDEVYDYFMIDYFGRIAYEHFDEVRHQLDECIPQQPDTFLLQSVLNETYPNIEFEAAKERTSIFKLNYYEKELLKQTREGNKTVYGYLTETYL